MRVLVACEFSGIVRDAFIAQGHEAISCDFRPTEAAGPHVKGNVLYFLQRNPDWDMVIAHPPCTYLANSGVHWLHRDETRWSKLEKSAAFFRTFLELDVPRIAVENPIPHKYAVELIGRKYDQIIRPYQYGHLEKKAICWWLGGLPLLKPTRELPAEAAFDHVLDESPNEDRKMNRSRFFTGIAEAMAEQWGST